MLYYSIGELIDRLCITNLKMWHLEEKMADKNISNEEKGKTISPQIISLNKQRNKIIESINEFFKDELFKDDKD